jgi:hypothetical protein
MSMIGNYRRISRRQLAALRANPASMIDFLYPDDQRPFSADEHLDIDKSWHAIHYLLNSDTWEGEPFFDVVLGGTELGEDIGYGPARYLSPKEVQAVANALQELPAFEVLERFDAQRLNDAEIYPHGWSGSPEELDYIRDNYLALTEYFRKVAEAKDAMLIYLN